MGLSFADGAQHRKHKAIEQQADKMSDAAQNDGESLEVAAFDYDLPEALIAQHPLPDRDASRLMVVDPGKRTIAHRSFRDLVEQLHDGDVLVFNNSKVLPARLHGIKVETGAKVELLLTKQLNEFEWEVMAKPAKRLRQGTVIYFSEPSPVQSLSPSSHHDSGQAVVTGVATEGLRTVRFTLQSGESMTDFLTRVGEMPLPPYIHEPLREQGRYQTVYAETEGSVAAPTAGLHFTQSLLEELKQRGVELQFVTLHVGIGTFRPVSASHVHEHQMHSETYHVDERVAAAINRAKAADRRVIAVGTTALRTLESAQVNGEIVAGTGSTDIFIYPGYEFKVIDGLITNFHLPKSTLLMLVAALMGTELMRRAYQEAVSERYRFFSFGDAMFITGRGNADDRTDSL